MLNRKALAHNLYPSLKSSLYIWDISLDYVCLVGQLFLLLFSSTCSLLCFIYHLFPGFDPGHHSFKTISLKPSETVLPQYRKTRMTHKIDAPYRSRRLNCIHVIFIPNAKVRIIPRYSWTLHSFKQES